MSQKFSRHNRMKKMIFIVAIMIMAKKGFPQTLLSPPSPEWTQDLIIYELSPKSFTSPNGPGSGTFRSTMEKIPYLRDLGINAVWLTGHHLADNKHFYGIWTQYAAIRPDSLDPSLGTPADFKAMVEAFHKNGIRVFLDVITHGVMNGSSLTKEHPEWFHGGSWGMTDYDWEGGHADLDEWWINLHVNYVLQYGIDGFRLDVDIYRPDLWKKIKQLCAEKGHPIVVWSEGEKQNDEGACDFYQRQTNLSLQISGIDSSNIILHDVAGYFQARTARPSFYLVYVHYTDGSVSIGNSFNNPQFTGYACGQLWWLLNTPLSRNMKVDVLEEYCPPPSNQKYPVHDKKTHLRLSNLQKEKNIFSITVTNFNLWEQPWKFGSHSKRQQGMAHNGQVDIFLEPVIPDVTYYSVQLSCHDDGWEGFPENGNPYVAEGSRCLFGYSCLFVPAIPIFMSGEEFNASFTPLPQLTPDLYGKGQPGKGKWLYGSWIQWDQLKESRHAQMLNDVKKMIEIRKAERDLIHAWRNDSLPSVMPLSFHAPAGIPVPYLLWNGHKALIIAGNNNEDKDIMCEVILPEIVQQKKFTRAFDLWNNTPVKIKGNSLSFLIKKDKSPGGGLAVIKLQ